MSSFGKKRKKYAQQQLNRYSLHVLNTKSEENLNFSCTINKYRLFFLSAAMCSNYDKNVTLPGAPGAPGLPLMPTPSSPLSPLSPFSPASPAEQKGA